MKKFSKTFKALCVLLGIFCSIHSLMPSVADKASASVADTRVKAVWAATVFSLDYPAKATTSAESLRKDMDNLLNNVQEMGYNHLFFQVRPSGDAFYDSDIYPWSKYLTGEYGAAPSGGFDPLEYLVEEAHKRSIAIHAWVNPYRITASAADADKMPVDAISNKFPHLTVKHTDGKLYLNPGEPEANQLVIDGIMEIVENYDVDGIHIDDYFYPDSSFPDGETFSKYGGAFGDIGDWRRENVTSLIRGINQAIKTENPDIIFSVSPCGIWANKTSNPDGSDTMGAQAYYDYYADTRLWVKEELVDWIMPQIYWNTGYAAADFETVAKWWSDTVLGTSVSLCIGQCVYKAADETNPDGPWYGQSGVDELNHQIKFMEELVGCVGYGHYRLGSLTSKPYLAEFAKAANTAKDSGNEENQEPLFSDLSAYPWAEEAIVALYEKGIVSGMGDGTFGGSRQVTRADFILMLVRILGRDARFTDNFEDVTEDKYYYKEIGTAKALGITNGRDGKIFDPGGSITRQDMATMVYRVLEKEGKLDFDEKFSLSLKFSDAHKISEYAEAPVAAMVDMGLLSGYETGEFIPGGNATRAETAVFLNRVAQLF